MGHEKYAIFDFGNKFVLTKHDNIFNNSGNRH